MTDIATVTRGERQQAAIVPSYIYDVITSKEQIHYTCMMSSPGYLQISRG